MWVHNCVEVQKHKIGANFVELYYVISLFRKGSKSGNSGRCNGCHGSGMRTVTRQIGPGMIQQMQHVCSDCRGSGFFLLHHFSSFASDPGVSILGFVELLYF
jgi:DnaJ central domain